MAIKHIDELLPEMQGLDPALVQLRRWRDERTLVWAYFWTRNGGVAMSLCGVINDAARCLAIENENGVARLDLKNGKFRLGPLQAALAPANAGRVAMLSQRPDGIAGRDGVTVVCEAGDTVFICDRPRADAELLALRAGSES